MPGHALPRAGEQPQDQTIRYMHLTQGRRITPISS